MYSIIKQIDGKYGMCCTIQDGVETKVCISKEEAVKTLIKWAKYLNGTVIKRKDIKFGIEQPIKSTEIVKASYEDL